MARIGLKGLLILLTLVGCQPRSACQRPTRQKVNHPHSPDRRQGMKREVAGVKLCWCPPRASFTMGSPPGEPERRPGEDQVEVTLTKGFLGRKVRGDSGPVEEGRRQVCRAR